MPNPAAIAYEAYRTRWNANTVNSTFMVAWEYASESEKEAWWAVVKALAAQGMGNEDQAGNELLLEAVEFLKYQVDPRHSRRPLGADIREWIDRCRGHFSK